MNYLRNILINRREGMIERCNNSNHSAYKQYGERGIYVCQEWLDSPQAFVDWAFANGFSPELQIDRIDNNKGYSPDNCRWVTARDNMRNRSNSVITPTIAGQAKFLYQIEEVTIKDIADYFGVNKSTMANVLAPNPDKWADIEPIAIDIPEVIMKNISTRLEAKQAKKAKKAEQVKESKADYDEQFAKWELRAAHVRYEREVLGNTVEAIRKKYGVTCRNYYDIIHRRKFPNVQPLKP